MELEPLSYYLVITKTLSLSHEEIKIGVAGPISTQKNIKDLWENDILTPQDGTILF